MKKSANQQYQQELTILITSMLTPIAMMVGMLMLLTVKGFLDPAVFAETSMIIGVAGLVIGTVFCNSLILNQIKKVNYIREYNDQTAEIREALDQGDIRPYFQSRVSQETGKITGCEALARWDDGDKIIPPSKFIPLSLKSGLIVEIDCEIALNAIKQLEKWIKKGTINDEFTLSFNITGPTLKNADAVTRIANALNGVVSPTVSIEIEITEQTLVDYDDVVIKNIAVLRDAGGKFALDDFTAGHSSMSMLGAFRFDTIKFDKSLITDANKDVETRDISVKMIESFVILSKRLGMETTLEGIDSEESLALYQQAGIENIQGFLFSKPSPSHEFEDHYRQFNVA